MESKRALASVFEVDLSVLEPRPEVSRRRRVNEAALGFVVAGGLIGLVLGLTGGTLGIARALSGSAGWGAAAVLVGIAGLVAGAVFAVKAYRAMQHGITHEPTEMEVERTEPGRSKVVR